MGSNLGDFSKVFCFNWATLPQSTREGFVSSDRSSYSHSMLLDIYRYSYFLRFGVFLPIYTYIQKAGTIWQPIQIGRKSA